VKLYQLAAAAEADGYRACLRCRPYRSAQPVSWVGPELVCRAVQLILDGALDQGTEADLGARPADLGAQALITKPVAELQEHQPQITLHRGRGPTDQRVKVQRERGENAGSSSSASTRASSSGSRSTSSGSIDSHNDG
jgi:hypothetical protein